MAHLYNEIWDKKNVARIEYNNGIKYDDWLEYFENIIEKIHTPIIDLGCGSGNNSLYLTEKKKEVISCDYSKEAINIINRYIPNSKTMLFDMTEKFPFKSNYTELILADLCLHYFSETITFNILDEIRRILKPGGYLIFRVNSVNDTNHGAIQGEEIEHNFFFTEDMTKRFFNKEDLLKFFKDWDIEYMSEELMTGRYRKDKILWRCAVKNNKIT
jgi:Methylase involved in ubiquinone/menaquinone biosynthesis